MGLFNNNRGSLLLRGVQSDWGKGVPCCSTRPVAGSGRFWLVLVLGEFKPALLKGCPDQHARGRPGKVLREGEAPPGLPQQHRQPCASQVQHCPTGTGPTVPNKSLLPETGTWGVFEDQGGYVHLCPSAAWHEPSPLRHCLGLQGLPASRGCSHGHVLSPFLGCFG